MANMQMTKTPMPEQDPNVRNKNFKEGLTFAEQNGCPTAQVGSGQYRVSYTMEQ